MKNPWRKLTSRIVYKNPRMTVREDKVINPAGKKGIYGIVELSGGVKVIAMTWKKEIYLVGQWRYTINKFGWELPGGAVEKNQSFIKAAENELEEEVGFKAKNWKYIGTAFESVGILNQKIKFYLATNLVRVIRKLEDPEKGMKVMKIPLEKVTKLIINDKIFEGTTMVGVFKTIEYLKNKK